MSVILWPLWESAANPLDDDVSSIVSGSDTLLQYLVLDQRREESWVDKRAEANLLPFITS